MTTRREALGMIGFAAGSLLICSGAGLANTEKNVSVEKMAEVPWPYEPLDAKACAQRAYQGYINGECMYGSFYGIIGELAAKKGEPYASFPFEMMKVGAGGGAGWATLCGALNGSMLAIKLLTKDPNPLVDELFNWYQKEPLPVFRPKTPRVEIKATSVANSPLCHASVSRWCKASGKKAFSLDRKERCAWLTASVAEKTVEILNAYHAKTFKSTYPIPDRVKECRGCHDQNGMLENARGKMECDSCHTSPILSKAHAKL